MYALNDGVSVAPYDKKYAPKTPKNTAGKVFPRMNSIMHERIARRPPGGKYEHVSVQVEETDLPLKKYVPTVAVIEGRVLLLSPRELGSAAILLGAWHGL